MSLLVPDWDVSTRVRAFATTRMQGNLAMHVGDADAARHNRSALVADYNLPAEPLWLEQVHGNDIVVAPTAQRQPRADGAYTRSAQLPLAVMVADCLPVLLATPDGDEIAVAHAGWRGLAGGVLAAARAKFRGDEVVAWLGPAIGPCHYEVDAVVRREFTTGTGFAAGRDGSHWMMDLAAIARHQLAALGIARIHGGGQCTWCDDRLFSHRRSGGVREGRFASVIWKT